MLATHLRMCAYPSQSSQHVSKNTRIYLPPLVCCYPTCIQSKLGKCLFQSLVVYLSNFVQ